MIAAAPGGLTTYIRRCAAGGDLTRGEMESIVGAMAEGSVSPAQSAALLVALALKGESAEEIAGAALALRARCAPVRCARRPLVDVCGTGGDGCGSFNISTAVAFVVAGAGVAVAKHGNRAMSGACGSADVAEALGVGLAALPAASGQMLEREGIAFLFAQTYHPALRNIAPVRREIGIRTLFNLLGPLCNPAAPDRQVVGMAHERAMRAVASALRELGSKRAAVVRATDGMDEVSLACSTRVVEWTGEAIIEYDLEPEMFGLRRRTAGEVVGGDAARNASIIRAVLRGESGAHREIVAANAALALTIAGSARNVTEGFAVALHSIDSGAAQAKLDALAVHKNLP